MKQEVNDATEQVCTRCFKVNPKFGYGEYKTRAFTKDTSPVQEVILPHHAKDAVTKTRCTIESEGVEVIQVQATQVTTRDVLNTSLIAIMMDVLNTILMVIWSGSSKNEQNIIMK